jgi:hypothetical protein
MTIIDRIKSFEFDRNRNNVFGIKAAIVWARTEEGFTLYPLLYISKPRWITQKDYDDILDRLQLSISIEPINGVNK